ncbi:unnamed protein product [Sympodiomycopsis kandeliae]
MSYSQAVPHTNNLPARLGPELGTLQPRFFRQTDHHANHEDSIPDSTSSLSGRLSSNAFLATSRESTDTIPTQLPTSPAFAEAGSSKILYSSHVAGDGSQVPPEFWQYIQTPEAPNHRHVENSEQELGWTPYSRNAADPFSSPSKEYPALTPARVTLDKSVFAHDQLGDRQAQLSFRRVSSGRDRYSNALLAKSQNAAPEYSTPQSRNPFAAQRASHPDMRFALETSSPRMENAHRQSPIWSTQQPLPFSTPSNREAGIYSSRGQDLSRFHSGSSRSSDWPPNHNFGPNKVPRIPQQSMQATSRRRPHQSTAYVELSDSDQDDCSDVFAYDPSRSSKSVVSRRPFDNLGTNPGSSASSWVQQEVDRWRSAQSRVEKPPRTTMQAESQVNDTNWTSVHQRQLSEFDSRSSADRLSAYAYDSFSSPDKGKKRQLQPDDNATLRQNKRRHAERRVPLTDASNESTSLHDISHHFSATTAREQHRQPGISNRSRNAPSARGKSIALKRFRLPLLPHRPNQPGQSSQLFTSTQPSRYTLNRVQPGRQIEVETRTLGADASGSRRQFTVFKPSPLDKERELR